MFDQPTTNDESSPVNCDGSDAVIDKLVDIIYSLKGRVSELEALVSEQQDTIEEHEELMDALGEFLQTDAPQERLIAYIEEFEDTVDSQAEIIERKDAIIDEKDDQIESQEEIIERKDDIIDEYDETLSNVREQLAKQNDERQAQIDTLQNEFSEYREDNEKDKALIRKDITDADEQSQNNLSVIDTIAQKVKGFRSELRRVNGGRTPLEQVVMLPDEIAHRADLSKNQLRAREIALNIDAISTQVPAGTQVRSSDIKEKLGELYDTAHDQTVSRVMDFLIDLAGEQCELIYRNGGKALIFDDELAEQLDCAEQYAVEDVEDVITNVVSINASGG